MKALSTLALAALVLPAMAQIRTELPAHPEGKHTGSPILHRTNTGAPKGGAYYAEDFDSGLGGWTVNTPVGNVDWEHTSTGPGPTTSTYPVPVLNTSTPAGWVIVDDDFQGVAGLSTETWLVSPIIDLSAAPQYLKVEFDQYFQEWQEDHTYVGVSTDGGVTWNEVEINEGVGRDGRPNPELVDVDISAWVANNPDSVQLRFRYTSVWDYGWQIDNVAIRDLPAHDMALLRTKQTGFDFANNGLANIEYSIYPVQQLREMQLGGTVKNKGWQDQTNVTFITTVNGPNVSEFNAGTTPASFLVGETAEPVVNGFTPSGDIGEYTIIYTVEQDSTDELPANNTDTAYFAVSEYTWAQDDGACDGVQVQGPSNQFDQFEVGNFFDVAQVGSELEGIQVALGDGTSVGTLIYGIVYDSNLDYIDQTDDIEVQPSDLTSQGGANFITLPFINPVQLNNGEAYCVMVGCYGGAEVVEVCTSGISVPQVSILRYPNSAENFFVTRTPMVRALLGGVVGIQESTSVFDGAISAWPNPFNGTVRFGFELSASADVTLSVHDVSGRIVAREGLGRTAAGAQLHTLDLGHLAPGSYTYVLEADGTRRTGVLVAAGR